MRRRFFKRARKPAAKSAKAVATKALRIAKKLRNESEIEWYPLTALSQNISTSATVDHLTPIATGDANNSRDGYVIDLKSVYGTFDVQRNSSSTVQSQTVCIAIVRMISGLAPATAPSFLSIFSANAPTALPNHDNQGTFKIIGRWVFNLDTYHPQKVINFYKKVNAKAYYQGTAGSNTTKGQLYLLYISSESTNVPTLTYRLATSYVDH